MIKEIQNQATNAGIEIAYVQFIGSSKSMDHLTGDVHARLYTLGGGEELVESTPMSLEQINELARLADSQLDNMIMAGEIDGLVLLSCDPSGANKEALRAAAQKGIPVVGTGGTSMATVQSLGCRVILASGTTGTTNTTRGIGAITAFSREWGLKYRAVVGVSSNGESGKTSVWKSISVRGIMMAAMPAFIMLSLAGAMSQYPLFSQLDGLFVLLAGALPVIIGAIAAKQVSGLDEVGIISGIIAGYMGRNGGILGTLLAGIIAGIMANYLIRVSFKAKVPTTTANIAAGGLSGLLAGILGMSLIAPISLPLADGIRFLLDQALGLHPVLVGAVFGFMIWFSIIKGVYHAHVLPLILLEMETTGFSFVGAIDMVSLVMVCAGIQLGNIIAPPMATSRAIAKNNMFINMAYGTYVEAAYPSILANKKLFSGTILAATLSGMAVGWLGVKSTAYIPVFLAPLLTNEGKSIALVFAMAIALVCSALFTIIVNATTKKAD